MTIRPKTTKSVVFLPDLLFSADLRAGPPIASGVRGGLLGRIAVCLALLSLLVWALESVCSTTLLTVARRDRTR